MKDRWDRVEEKFTDQLCKLHIELSRHQKEQFRTYYELLVEWNKVMNLTGITQEEEVYEKHFVDSLAAAKAVDLTKTDSLADVGTGAGFPGIPLKIAFPHMQVTLLDSLNKRVQFLNCVTEKLGLKEIETVHGRAEDLAKNKAYREKFGLCVSRAVSNLSTLSEYCLPFIRVGGIFVSYKSSSADEEIRESEYAISVLGGNIERIEKFKLPETEIERAFVIIQKSRQTPAKYPRKAGTPAKDPLKK